MKFSDEGIIIFAKKHGENSLIIKGVIAPVKMKQIAAILCDNPKYPCSTDPENLCRNQ